MEKKYKKYTVDELLQDDYFISSILHPTQESREFWDFLIQSGNLSAQDFEEAAFFIEVVHSPKEKLLRKEKEALWSKIEIENKSSLKKKIRTLYAACFSAVACVFILLGVSLYFFYESNRQGDNMIDMIAAFKKEKNVQPGSDICLVLSDNKQMRFEEDNTDVKYDDKGQIKVNSQTVMEGKKDKKAVGDKKEKEATVTYNQLIVPKGKHSTLLLSDGTKLWVNAGSHVIFPVSFKGDKREIYVDGEVFLDVTRNEGNPFVVKTDRMAVEVLGTSFNVKSYGHEETDDVVLVTGSVHVRTEAGRKAELIPNQRFRCTSAGDVDIQTVDVYDYISWKDGLLQYKKERLSVILQRLSDYYGKPIQWEPELERLTCSGKLDLKDDMEKVLNGLTKMIPVKFVKQDDCYYFSVTPLNSKPME